MDEIESAADTVMADMKQLIIDECEESKLKIKEKEKNLQINILKWLPLTQD
jgi:hypothetical protein